MATLESNDANILDAETINLRWIVYPALAAIVLIVGGFSYYYYEQNQHDLAEDQARAALLLAATPEELIKVADDSPNTAQATLALLSAADQSFGKRDYPAAIATYQRIIATTGTAPELRDSAQVGLASTCEAAGQLDNAVTAYLQVARRGNTSAYAPFAYLSAARIDEQRGDKENAKKILTEAIGTAIDSPFIKQAQTKLQELNTPPPPPATVNAVPVSTTATNAAPTPAPAANAAPSPALAPAKK